MEVLADLQPGALLEDRQHLLARRPRLGRRLEHDELALAQPGRDLARRRRARSRGPARAAATAGSAARSGSRRPRGARRSRSSRTSPLVDERRQALVRDVLDVALAAVEPSTRGCCDVDAGGRACPPPRRRGRAAGRRSRPRRSRCRVHAGARLACSAAATFGSVAVAVEGRALVRACAPRRGRRRAAPGRRRRGRSRRARRCRPTRSTGARVTQGTPNQYASFWSPPESVTTTRACETSAAMSR